MPHRNVPDQLTMQLSIYIYMCVYLFHCHIFSLLLCVCGWYNLTPSSSLYLSMEFTDRKERKILCNTTFWCMKIRLKSKERVMKQNLFLLFLCDFYCVVSGMLVKKNTSALCYVSRLQAVKNAPFSSRLSWLKLWALVPKTFFRFSSFFNSTSWRPRATLATWDVFTPVAQN